MAEESIKFNSIGSLADKFGIDKATFWDCFSTEHLVDMIQLGYKPHKKLINPACVKYIEQVIVKRNDRKEVFPNLKSLS